MKNIEKQIRELDIRVSRIIVRLDQCDEDCRQEIYALITAYINLLSDFYGISEWLDWWIFECECGFAEDEKKQILIDGELLTVKTIDDFVKIVCGKPFRRNPQ